MTEPTAPSAAAHSSPAAASAASRSLPSQRGVSAVRFGGAVGIAAVCIGVIIFLTACMGFEAALLFSPIPLALGICGLLATITGGILVRRHHAAVEETHPLAALMLNVGAIFGGLALVAMWQSWRIFGMVGGQ